MTIKKYSLLLCCALLAIATHAQDRSRTNDSYDNQHYDPDSERASDELIILPPYPYQEIGGHQEWEDWDALEESMRKARKEEKRFIKSLNKRDRKAYKKQRKAERKEARRYYKFLRKEEKKADKAYAKTLSKRDRKEFKRMRKQERKRMKRWVRHHYGEEDD